MKLITIKKWHINLHIVRWISQTSINYILTCSRFRKSKLVKTVRWMTNYIDVRIKIVQNILPINALLTVINFIGWFYDMSTFLSTDVNVWYFFYGYLIILVLSVHLISAKYFNYIYSGTTKSSSSTKFWTRPLRSSSRSRWRTNTHLLVYFVLQLINLNGLFNAN